MSTELDSLAAILTRYVSAVNARAIIVRALRENGVSPTEATRKDLWNCSTTLRKGIELFVTVPKREAALRALSEFYGSEAHAPETCSVNLRSEADVRTARSEARKLCDLAGTDPFTMQKVTTIVSELARNIVLYAQTGTIEMGPANGNRKRILIRASDQGPGIPNIDQILSGQYKSKTGLGRGLAGTKRLADRFDISTGSAGTNVVVEVAL